MKIQNCPMKLLMVFKIVILLPLSLVFGQSSTIHTKTEKVKNGELVFTAITPEIVKVTFLPNHYTKNEYISDAVILKKTTNHTLPSIQRVDDKIIVANKIVITSTLQSNTHHGFVFELEKNEQIFGGGERALPLNRRGYQLQLYNNPWYGYSEGADNLNFSVPFFTSNKGYALFFDNVAKGYVDIGKKNSNLFEYGTESGALVVYIIMGSNYKSILKNFYQLTGTQPLPPRWALGNFMSRFGYTSEQQVKEIYEKMKAEKIPVDAVIFDLFWFGDSIKNGMGNLSWVNKQKWPNPKGMIDYFKQNKVNTILVTEPFVIKNTLAYPSSKPYLSTDSFGKSFHIEDFYFGNAGLIDIFRKDAQQWFWKYYQQQMQIGVEGWWGDLGEPEKHPTNMYHQLKDIGFSKRFSANEVHNMYGHYWTKMLYQQFEKNYPNKRLFSLNRSGFAGTQRYSIFPWTGDVSRSWSGFKAQLPVLLGMSMSGIPYVHSDAGGFAGGEGDEELYVRWLQMAAFTPIFRPHGTALYEIEKAAFSFPSEPALINQTYKKIAKKAVDLRYTFLPYNYTLAYQQTAFGEPLMRPLYFEHPSDSVAYTIEDEYFWGNDILVAPILQKNATTRKVYLPKGKWYNYFSKNEIIGNQTIEVATSLEQIPLFVKEGTILPTYRQSLFTNTSNLKNNQITLEYFPSNKASKTNIYFDDGVSKNALQQKKFELITCSAYTSSTNSYHFTIQSNGGNYTGKPLKTVYTIVINDADAISTIVINGLQQKIKLKKNNNQISFPLVFTGKPLKIDVQ